MDKNFTFNTLSEYSAKGITQALISLNQNNRRPVFICIGSDLVLGDSLGPLVGTFLKSKNVQSYVYGTLNYPITAKEVEYAGKYLKQMHPNCISIAIDAAIGNADDVGLVRVLDKGLKPGLGVDKNLNVIGDISIVGIVAGKSLQNYNLFNLTRLNLIYKMAQTVAEGIEKYIEYFSQSDDVKKAT